MEKNNSVLLTEDSSDFLRLTESEKKVFKRAMQFGNIQTLSSNENYSIFRHTGGAPSCVYILGNIERPDLRDIFKIALNARGHEVCLTLSENNSRLFEEFFSKDHESRCIERSILYENSAGFSDKFQESIDSFELKNSSLKVICGRELESVDKSGLSNIDGQIVGLLIDREKGQIGYCIVISSNRFRSIIEIKTPQNSVVTTCYIAISGSLVIKTEDNQALRNKGFGKLATTFCCKVQIDSGRPIEYAVMRENVASIAIMNFLKTQSDLVKCSLDLKKIQEYMINTHTVNKNIQDSKLEITRVFEGINEKMSFCKE